MAKPTLMILLVSCCLCGLTGVAGDIPELEFEKFTLPNGLQVILHEDHSIPIASVNMWYHVGSKNERRGRTGFAHLFEHLMFEGSKNVPEGMFDEWLEAAGGDNNGSTSEDRTNYWENVPSNALELALFLEADRMAHLLDTVDQAKLDGQRDIVKNERRQGVDNQPYGLVDEIMLEALYPYDHPYSWSVIGSLEDLSAASLEDVQEFFRKYYSPNNASLCIAGDIDPVETRKWVEKYFLDIPPGPPVSRVSAWVPTLESERVLDLKDNVSLPRLYLSWHSPRLYGVGDADMDILASILTSGKNSRMYKSLVYEKQIAQDVSAYQDSREISSIFNVVVTAKPGRTLEELRAAVDEELGRLRNEGPTQQEVETAVNAHEADVLRRLQSVGGFRGKANLLNGYNVFTGRPSYLSEDLARFAAVTPESVREAAGKYLLSDQRVVVRVTPAGDLAADESVKVDRTKRPPTGPSPSITLPAPESTTLSNGLKVLVVQESSVPLVQFFLSIGGGWTTDPEGKPGVSSLTSELQDEGTRSRTALQLSEDLKSIGVRLRTSSSFDGSYVSLNTLKKHMPKALDLFGDVLINPTFPEEELDRKKLEYLARMMQEKRRPFTAAIKNFLQILYGEDHPYGQPYTGTGTEQSLEAINRKDLVSCYEAYFRPNNATLIVVGDVSVEGVVPLLESSLGGWRRAEVPEITIPETKPLTESQVYLIDKPGAAQSVLVFGHHGILRNSPDYFSAEVMNTVLGGKFTSRLNMNLREDKGYSYGAFSQFLVRRGLGSFIVATQVHSEATKESVVEVGRELRGLQGDRPVAEQELVDTRNYVALRFPREFETLSQIASKLNESVTYDLPPGYFDRYVGSIQSVTAEQVAEAAGKYIRPSKMLYVIVGDVETIDSGIRELNLGEIHYRDLDGNPIER